MVDDVGLDGIQVKGHGHGAVKEKERDGEPCTAHKGTECG